MKKFIICLAILLVPACVAAVSTASHADEFHFGISNPEAGQERTAQAPEDRADVVWHQEPNVTTALTSEDDISASDLDSWVIDDFVLDADTTITALEWAGGTTLGTPPYSFIVTFYAAPPECGGPDDPGLIISEQSITSWDEEPLYWQQHYTADIDPLSLPAGQYWLGIRGVVDNGVHIYWTWQQSYDDNLCEAMLKFPVLGYNVFTPLSEVPELVNFDRAQAFTLIGDVAVDPFDVNIDCLTPVLALPAQGGFSVDLTNNSDTPINVAAHVDVTLCSGVTMSNIRSGNTNLSVDETYTQSWTMPIPALGTTCNCDLLWTLTGHDTTTMVEDTDSCIMTTTCD